jgi:tetratricopeptide (TPR) repeat protein
MGLFRRKKQTEHHIVGDFGSAEINVTKRRGELPMIDITMSVKPEYAHGLAFQHKREELGLNHPETLAALHQYAVTLGALPGRENDAVELLEWLVGARADDQENRLPALNDLTRILQDGGNLARAEVWLREALSGWERLRGQDDPETLRIASNLARALIDLGRQEEAEGLIRDTAARYARTLGAGHPDTLSSRNVLAGALRGSPARLAEAERVYGEILAAAGEVSDLSLSVRNNLAAVLNHQGKHKQALQMYSALVEDWSQVHGDDDTGTWQARHNLAAVLSALGRVEEAETRLTEVLAGYRRLFGRRHAKTLDSQVDLAATKANQGRNAEAVPLLRDALEGYRSTHGPDHPYVRELTGILRQLGG